MILDPKDVTVSPEDIEELKTHQRLMGESPKKKPQHCNKGKKTCVQCYFKNREDESINPEILDMSMRIRDEVEHKVIDRIDKQDVYLAPKTVDLEHVIQQENEKYLKTLEKTLQNEPEYEEIKHYIDQHPDEKEKYLQTIALKYNPKLTPVKPVSDFELKEYNSFTSKHAGKGSRGWSEVKSNPTHDSHYSSSVRHSRYRAMGLNDQSKKDYFRNLRVIKKLQNEKKKREKVMQYFGNKTLLKQQAEEARLEEEKERLKEEKEREMEEWKEK